MSNRSKRTVFNIHFLGGNDDNNLYISRIVVVEMLKNVLNLYFALKSDSKIMHSMNHQLFLNS